MPDARVEKLAKVLVKYSLDIQPGEEMVLEAESMAQELSLAAYKEAMLAGAHVLVMTDLPGATEAFFKHASDAQMDYVSPVLQLVIETFTARLAISAPENTRRLSGVEPARFSRRQKARAGLFKTFMERAASGDLKWCGTLYPTNASAQEADMSLSDYEDFVYTAGKLDLPDPVEAWRIQSERQEQLVRWLKGKEQVAIKGANVDVTLSIKGRGFINACGQRNFPDGEIFTSPVEDSVNGWVRFAYPAIYAGREVEDIELWFEDGKVVKETATKGQDLLTALLDTDDGARYLGEWGIGTNYDIQRFTKNMLFDEKMGGTIHFAVGFGFPEIGCKNESTIHWDMLCDMADSEVLVDGELFYKDGKFEV